jgi:hypothetical protein
MASSLARWLVPVLLLGMSRASPVDGQEPFALRLDTDAGAVRVELAGVLAGPRLRESLDAGLPVRIRVVTELWRDGFFDSQVARHEWRATVRYDPLARSHRVELPGDIRLEAASPEEVGQALESALDVPLRPNEPGRYYYLARMDVETLSLSDLEELQRWLSGELAPSLGSPEVGSAVGRGLRRLLVRVLGLPVQRLQSRTPRFNWSP